MLTFKNINDPIAATTNRSHLNLSKHRLCTLRWAAESLENSCLCACAKDGAQRLISACQGLLWAASKKSSLRNLAELGLYVEAVVFPLAIVVATVVQYFFSCFFFLGRSGLSTALGIGGIRWGWDSCFQHARGFWGCAEFPPPQQL